MNLRMLTLRKDTEKSLDYDTSLLVLLFFFFSFVLLCLLPHLITSSMTVIAFITINANIVGDYVVQGVNEPPTDNATRVGVT